MRTRVVITAAAALAVASRRRRPAPAPVVAAAPRLALLEDDSDLVVAEQDARDERVLAVLDAHLRAAG